MKRLILLFAILLYSMTAFADTSENICIFQEGVVIFETDASGVDSICIKDNKVYLYDNNSKLIYQVKTDEIDSIRFLPPVPKADILDVKFNPDGTAEDISPMKNTIEAYGNPQVFFSSRYGRYEVRFGDNSWAGKASRYYKISYADNDAFQNALADGHTMETVIRCSYTGSIQDGEAKFFSSHQSGGTGLMISKISGARENELTFLPYVGGSWRWATSGIVPESDVYYHIVGVWNKTEEKAYIYVNGELKNTVAASGDFKFPATNCYYFAIGGDPSNATTVNQAWNGDVVLSRIYDKALTKNQVTSLWNRLEELRGNEDVEMVKKVHYYSGLQVVAGKGYDIYGVGFKDGDKINFVNTDNDANSFSVDCSLTADGVHFNLPGEVVSGSYRMLLSREGMIQDLGANELTVVSKLPRGAQVVAHRGYWKAPGAAQNSRASLQAALDLKDCYGSETDVWLTTDGHIMVNHDASLSGVTIQTSTYDQVKNLTLSNGEKIPQLQDFLNMMAADNSETKLIIEIKTHSSVERTCACVDSVVAAVKAMGLENRVEYIAFSLDGCKEAVKMAPTAMVQYLNGTKTPQELYNDGIMGLDYTQAKMTDSYISNAHSLGMIVNVWTIDSDSEIVYTNNRDADFVTTNYPESALKVYKHYKNNR